MVTFSSRHCRAQLGGILTPAGSINVPKPSKRNRTDLGYLRNPPHIIDSKFSLPCLTEAILDPRPLLHKSLGLPSGFPLGFLQ